MTHTLDIETPIYTLEDIFYPISVADVAHGFACRKHFYVRGTAEKFRGLFSRERLEQCLQKADRDFRRGIVPSSPVFVKVSFDHGRTHLPVAPHYATRLYRAGATVCVEGIGAVDETLRAVAVAAKRQVSFVGATDFRVYLSPSGQGFATHFDARIATTLQIEGRKRWRFSKELALDWPHYQAAPGKDGGVEVGRALADWEMYRKPNECTFEEIVLEPGDLLCLPAGSWHSAEAVGHSLALNMAFGATGDFWDVIEPLVLSDLAKNWHWREPPPPIPWNPDTTEFPPDVASYFDSRIDLALETLTRLKADRGLLYSRWRELQAPTPNVVNSSTSTSSRRRWLSALRARVTAARSYYGALSAAPRVSGVKV